MREAGQGLTEGVNPICWRIRETDVLTERKLGVESVNGFYLHTV